MGYFLSNIDCFCAEIQQKYMANNHIVLHGFRSNIISSYSLVFDSFLTVKQKSYFIFILCSWNYEKTSCIPILAKDATAQQSIKFPWLERIYIKTILNSYPNLGT